MAFCTSCGTRVADGAKFCTSCGTPLASAPQAPVPPQPVVQPEPIVAAPAPTPAPEAPAPAVAVTESTPVVAPTPAPEPAPVPLAAAPVAAAAAPAVSPAPVATAPAQPAKKSSALKIILIVLLVLFILGVLVIGAVVGVGYYATKKLKEKYNVQQTTNGEVNIKTPFGAIDTTEDAAKIAAQMGVDVYSGATPLSEGTASSSFGGISVMTAVFETTDSIDQVEQFYREKYPSSTVSASTDTKRAVIFTTPKGLVTVTLVSADGKTKINMGCIPSEKKTDTGSSE